MIISVQHSYIQSLIATFNKKQQPCSLFIITSASTSTKTQLLCLQWPTHQSSCPYLTEVLIQKGPPHYWNEDWKAPHILPLLSVFVPGGLNCFKSPGCDGISSHVLKNCSSSLYPVIDQLFSCLYCQQLQTYFTPLYSP